MTVLMLAEVQNGKLALDLTARAIAAVHGLGDITVLCCGSDAEKFTAEVAQIAGVSKVLCAAHVHYDHALAEPTAALLAELAPGYSHIVAPATANSRSFLPRVAALLDVMILSDVSAVISPDTFERSIYAGSAIQSVKSSDAIKVVTVRTAAYQAAGYGTPAPVENIPPAINPGLSEWIADKTGVGDRPELTSAKTVVSGGRGLGSEDGFALIVKLADELGAAVGASRAAVDSGYAPNDWQVGQTGKIVAPALYIAVGISGAVQHLAGMKDSKIIVAINKDDEAPIFQIADYGLVADLFEALPELIEKI